MSSITEDVTEQYFESKAEEEMDTNSVIFEHMTVMSYQEVLRDKRFMGYTDSQIVKYTIPSSSIKHDQCYIHVEEVVRDIIDTGITTENQGESLAVHGGDESDSADKTHVWYAERMF
jgi:hypothetical protein